MRYPLAVVAACLAAAAGCTLLVSKDDYLGGGSGTLPPDAASPDGDAGGAVGPLEASVVDAADACVPFSVPVYRLIDLDGAVELFSASDKEIVTYTGAAPDAGFDAASPESSWRNAGVAFRAQSADLATADPSNDPRGLVAVHRLYQPSTKDRVYVLDPMDPGTGGEYLDEGVVFYAAPAGPEKTGIRPEDASDAGCLQPVYALVNEDKRHSLALTERDLSTLDFGGFRPEVVRFYASEP